MEQAEVLGIFEETIFLILKLGGPLLLVSILVGLIVSIFQAATQIHEQTLTFVPKVLAIIMVLLAAGSWMLTSIMDFFTYLMDVMARL